MSFKKYLLDSNILDSDSRVPTINLSEVFDTTVDIDWSLVDNHHRGVFKLDSDIYTIHIDEYNLNLTESKVLLDVGFDYNKSMKLTNMNKNSSRILGIVSNGIKTKILELKHDLLVFGASNTNGNPAGRMRIYAFIASRYQKLYGYYLYKLDEYTKRFGLYTIVSKDILVEDDLKIVLGYIGSE